VVSVKKRKKNMKNKEIRREEGDDENRLMVLLTW